MEASSVEQAASVNISAPGRTASCYRDHLIACIAVARICHLVMAETSFWIKFVLAVLATWRITHLLSSEDGPADLIVRMRATLGDGLVGRLVDCFKCLSIWVAFPAAFFVGGGAAQLVVTWLAISAAACLIQRAGQDPIVIRALPDQTRGGIHDELLRSKEGSLQEQSVARDDATRN